MAEDSKENKKSMSKKKKFLIGIVAFVIIVTVFGMISGGDDSESSSNEINNASNTEVSDKKEESSNKEPEVEQYSGCNGLEKLIPKLKSTPSMQSSWIMLAQVGDKAACDNLISKLDKPENYKD